MKRIRICPICGRAHNRITCEYCGRLQKWKERTTWEDRLSSFPPRIQDELPDLQFTAPDPTQLINKSLYLWGSVGTGKTMLAAKIAYEQQCNSIAEAQNYKQPVFITMPDLLQEIQSTFTKNSEKSSLEILDKCRNSEFLIIDDFGVEKPSEWAFQTVYSIINHRYEYRLQTIITSNYSLKHISNQLNDDRVPERIGAMCIVLSLKTKLRRKI